jgi:hypothetical protein
MEDKMSEITLFQYNNTYVGSSEKGMCYVTFIPYKGIIFLYIEYIEIVFKKNRLINYTGEI